MMTTPAEYADCLQFKLTQAREELAAVDEALGEFYCPVLDKNDQPCGAFYADHGVNVMRQELERLEHELEITQRALEDAQADMVLNSKMLADQCDQARQAENERDEARRIARRQYKALMQAQADLAGATRERIINMLDPEQAERALQHFRKQLQQVRDEVLDARRESPATDSPGKPAATTPSSEMPETATERQTLEQVAHW